MRRRRKLEVSTFPFLAVLLCAMGSLILVLLAMDRKAKLAARAKAELAARKVAEDAELLAAARRAEWERARDEQRADWQRKRDELHTRLESDKHNLEGQMAALRARLADSASQLRAELDGVAELERKAEAEKGKIGGAARALADKRAAVERAKAESAAQHKALRKMTADLALLENTLADLKAARERERQTYSVVPYRGKHGESRRPLYIECAANTIVFHPDKVRLSPYQAGELRAEVVRRVAQQKEIIQTSGGSADPVPYLMLLVRPDGVPAYYQFQAALRGMEVRFGYEFIDADWILDFPAEDKPSGTWPPQAEIARSGAAAADGPRGVMGLRPAGVPLSPGGAGEAGGRPGPGGGSGSGSGSGFGSGNGPPGVPGDGVARGVGGVPGGGTAFPGGRIPGTGGSGGGSGATGTGTGVAGGLPGAGGTDVGGTGVAGRAPIGVRGVDYGGGRVLASSGGQVPGSGNGFGLGIGPAGSGTGQGSGGVAGWGNGTGSGSGTGSGGVAGSGNGPGSGNGGNGTGSGSVAGTGTGTGSGNGPGSGGTGPFGGTGGIALPPIAGPTTGSGSGAAGTPGSSLFGGSSQPGNNGSAGGGTGQIAGSGAPSLGVPGDGRGAPGGTPATSGAGSGGGTGSGSGGYSPLPSLGGTGSGSGGTTGQPGGASGGVAGSRYGTNGARPDGTPPSPLAGAMPRSPFPEYGSGSGQPGSNVRPPMTGTVPPPPFIPGQSPADQPSQVNQPNPPNLPAGTGQPVNPGDAPPTRGDNSRAPVGGLPRQFGQGGGDGDGEGNPFGRYAPASLQKSQSPGPRKPVALRPARLGGDRDYFIYVECRADSVVLYPAQRVFPLAVLSRGGSNNPLAQAVQQMIDRRQALAPAGTPPYRPQVCFLVRPENMRGYHTAYPALDGIAIPKTRHNLDADDDVLSIVTGH